MGDIVDWKLEACSGLRAVESDSRLDPQWTGEASSTLPLREEETQDSSYAAADGCLRTDPDRTGGLSLE